jgi:hypothetical protein
MKSRKDREGTPDPLIKSQSQSRPEPNIDKKAQPFRGSLAFSSTMEGVCSAQATAAWYRKKQPHPHR